MVICIKERRNVYVVILFDIEVSSLIMFQL